MAGVLTLVRAVPRLLDRLLLVPPKGGAAVAMSIALAWCGLTFSLDWTPMLGGRLAYISEAAYLEPLPDGRYLADLPREKVRWFPVTPIQRSVESVYGPDPRRVALSADERLFAYLPWPGYAGNVPSGSLGHTRDRVAELRRLAGIQSPSTFAQASAGTAFGPIDIFVLRETADGWRWSSYMGLEDDEVVVFYQPEQFSSAHWVVFDNLPEDIVVAVRRP
jgi:hypothetical protein